MRVQNRMGLVKGGSVAGLLFGVALIVAFFRGWILNVIDVTDIESFGDMSGREILSCVGVFLAPLGAVLGWL